MLTTIIGACSRWAGIAVSEQIVCHLINRHGQDGGRKNRRI